MSMPEIEPPTAKAQRLLKVIAEQIASGRIQANRPETFLAFSEALSLLGMDSPESMAGSRLSTSGLHDLHLWTAQHEELPKVTALIVNKANRRPHEDFPKWHGHGDDPEWEKWWLEEANRAIAYDWGPFVTSAPPYTSESVASEAIVVREDGETELPDYGAIITVDPERREGRPCIRGMRITVGDILGWLAQGKSERQILEEFPDLTRQDILASLAYAADREKQRDATEEKISRLSQFAEKWKGNLTLPESDPNDPRMDYLLERYWRHRK